MPRSPLEDPALIADVLRNVGVGIARLHDALDGFADAVTTALVEFEQYAIDVEDEDRAASRAEALSDPWWTEVQKTVEP